LVIAKNGDVAATFLVDGMVAGTWDVRWRGPATIRLTALAPLRARDRTAVAAEARRLVAWIRPDAATHDVLWAD
jgi:hypothetical protein